MLINLSNHPSTKWTDTQCDTAKKQYGKVVDIPFPRIPPEATKEEIEQLTEMYAGQIQKVAGVEATTVHLMGEMTFTYMLVNKLREEGVLCIASTTNRTVEERDGKKIVQFNFVQFRPYF